MVGDAVVILAAEFMRSAGLFIFFHQEQTNTEMKMASKSMNINSVQAIIFFSSCNHRFLRVSPSNSDTEFKTQYALQRLTHRKMKYLTVLPIILNRIRDRQVGGIELSASKINIQENFRTQQTLLNEIVTFVYTEAERSSVCVS